MNNLRQLTLVTIAIMRQKYYLLLFVFIWLATLWIFMYFTSFDVFIYVFQNPSLDIWSKIIFALESITNIFKNITNPLAFSIILFSLLAAVNILIMTYLLRNKTKARVDKRTSAATVAALVGSHCVTCGGSLLAPVLTALAGSGAYFSSARANWGLVISLLVNAFGMILIIHSTGRLAKRAAELTGLLVSRTA